MDSPIGHACAWCLTFALGACVGQGEAAPGARVAIAVAPLNLTGISDVDYTITVTNGGGGGGDVVWTRPLSSSAYGDGAGALSYVGTCDASTGLNTVTLALTALHDAGGEVPTSSYLNPGPIAREVTCVEGADAAVTFDLTVARQADQGFFDVAIQFDDIYCSAKLDCCEPSQGASCAGDGTDDLMLLFDAAGVRGRTIVLGLACTAGTEVGVVTELVLDDLLLDCDVGSTDATFVADVTIDPNGDAAGNQCDAGALGGCAAITEHGTASADAFLFQVATFRGEEALTTAAGPAHIAYWNVALGVTGSISQCTLRTRATAIDAADPTGPVEGADYPYVFWDADLGSCAAEELDLDTPGGTLTSSYAAFLPLIPDPPVILYAPTTLTCTLGQACALDAPASTGGTVESFAIAPTLPAGLSLDGATGAIAGTPTALSTATTYAVTASNSGGDAAASVTVTVIDVPPSALTYSPSSLTCTRTQPCSLAAPTHGGGPVVSYGIAPALPAGLAINTGTGAISGTPTVVSGAASYTVTATNTGGSTAATITVSVVEPSFSAATFTNANATGENGPTQAQLDAAYAGTALAGKVTLTAGAQRWVVPATGTYRIQASGGAGGPGYSTTVSGGKGATIRGDFNLNVNTVLYIVVGQAGSTNGAGGGTFVWIPNAAQPLVAAGGGGGPGGHPTALNFGNGKPGATTTAGTSGNGSGAGGTGGGAGSPGAGYGSNGLNGSGGGGAGWNGDATGGYVGTQYNALHRGRAGTGGGGGASGWGGGGSAWLGGGGGGGYSGGGGGSWSSGTGGGGGGSYNAGTSQSNVSGNHSGQGQVLITKL